MPLETRWAARLAMLYLVVGLTAGFLYWADQQWGFAPILAAMNPTYLHVIVIGWLTQLIFGVIYWMFPIIGKDNMRGDPRLARAVLVLLNVGLLLRIVCEPWRTIDPTDLNGAGLLLSAIFQALSGYLIVAVCWPRIRERAGSNAGHQAGRPAPREA